MSANTYLPISPVAPYSLLISNITQSARAVITVTTTNGYVVGQKIHLSVPFVYGMNEIDQLTGEILAINGLDFTTDINTITFNAFVIPSGNVTKPASLAPQGSRNLYNINFVPFHSIDGQVGN